MKNKLLGRQNRAALLVCLLGIGINFTFNGLTKVFGLPLYLDTVGTIASAAVGGYLPGVVVGFATNLIKSISTPDSRYYGFINVLIALLAAFFAKRGWLKKWWGIGGSILAFTAVGGGLGSLVTYVIQDGTQREAFLQLISDLPDKIISVSLAILILRAIPEKSYKYCGFTMWLQNPDEGAKVASQRESGVRLLSLRVKMLAALIFSMFIIAITGLYISVRIYDNTIMDDVTKLAKGTALLAAKQIDGNRVDEYLNSGGTANGYSETQRKLEDILESSPDANFLYVYRMEEDGYRVVFDVDTPMYPADPIGTFIEYEEAFVPYIPQLLAGEKIKPLVTVDEYGYLLTAMEPVYDSSNHCVCYAVVDVDLEQLTINDRKFFVKIITIFLSYFLFVCTFIMWLTDYHIVYPVRSITNSLDKTFNQTDTQNVLDEEVKAIRKINIHTGDELEKLYASLCRMTLNQTEQMRSIRRLSESTVDMQDGLIITMADMVENRDSDTGAHIQKTAAYVRIILEGLKKKGYYAEKLTPKFISDAVRSAPLHDVGKINVPDAILNKTGDLTDEEYEIMKSHTTAGKQIIEHAISTFRGDNYLKEARNMAAYHHERWDGTGYPDGLHGEVIPLSARVMAVADAFDTLTSEPVNGKTLSVTEAFTALEENKGTRFDPKCVEVFVESADEVKIIFRKYNDAT